MAISTKRKKYKTAEITELSRYFKEVAEAFEEDPKQIFSTLSSTLHC